MSRADFVRRGLVRARGLAQRLRRKPLALAVAVLLLILASVWGFQASSQSQFCRTCHEMEYNYQTWRVSSHHDVSCESCHIRPGLIGMMQTKLHGLWFVIVHVKERPTEAEVPLAAHVDDRICLGCHDPPPGEVHYHLLRITHKRHVARGMHCTDCHANVVHGGRAPYKNTPTMESCYRCHDGKQAPNQCSLCHAQLGEIKPQLYNPAWVDLHRKNLADTGRQQCQKCHGQSFCSSCHRSVSPHGPGFLDKHRATPAKEIGQCAYCHVPRRGEKMARMCLDCHNARRAHGPQYETTHPQEYRREPQTCWKCHNQRFCDDCHKIYRPHPLNWIASHGKASRQEGRECSVCHTTQFCEKCHTSGRPASHGSQWRQKHGEVAQANRASCAVCHTPQMCRQCHLRQPPATHRQADWRSASAMTVPRSVAVASSSRSRNRGESRLGTGPRSPSVPTSALGGR